MEVRIRLEMRGNDWVAYLPGKSSPIVRPVPGNAYPAQAARWPSREAALEELAELIGCQVREVTR